MKSPSFPPGNEREGGGGDSKLWKDIWIIQNLEVQEGYQMVHFIDTKLEIFVFKIISSASVLE